jgi:hypothetical protein
MCRAKILWLMAMVLVSLLLLFTDGGGAQPPPPKKGPGGKGPALTTEDLVNRILSYDKRKIGKVTKDDLPERLHFLVDLGDVNKDGYLDREEIGALADKLAVTGLPGDPGGPGAPGPKGGKGPPKGPPGGKGPALEQRITDLEQKMDVLLRQMEDMRKLMEKSGAKDR